MKSKFQSHNRTSLKRKCRMLSKNTKNTPSTFHNHTKWSKRSQFTLKWVHFGEAFAATLFSRIDIISSDKFQGQKKWNTINNNLLVFSLFIGSSRQTIPSKSARTTTIHRRKEGKIQNSTPDYFGIIQNKIPIYLLFFLTSLGPSPRTCPNPNTSCPWNGKFKRFFESFISKWFVIVAIKDRYFEQKG